MIQQVNLYQDRGTRKHHALLNPYLLAVIGALLCFMLISGIGLLQRHQHRTDLETIQGQLRQAQERVESLRARHPNTQPDLTLLQELQHAQGLQQSLSEIMELLVDNQSDRARGFSRYLATLANQADGSAWLTGIHIDNETGQFTLQGSAFKAEHIPLLLQRLQNADAFKGRRFAKLSIQQSQQLPEQVDFSVSSKLDPDKEMANASKP